MRSRMPADGGSVRVLTRTVAIATALASAFPAAAITTQAAAAAPAAHTGLGIKLLDAPAALVKDPRARSYIIDHVAPGTTIVRHIQVSDDTGGPIQVALYADAATVANGGFTPLAGRTQNELTSWTTVTPSSVSLAQGQQAVATVTIRVPRDAERGERYGAIFAETSRGHASTGFSIVSRVGIRAYLDVGFGAAPKSDFAILAMTAGRTRDGRPLVQSAVRNIGGRALDMVGQLWLKRGPGGLSAGPFPVKLGTTLGIGQTEPVSVVLDKALPPGPWLAHLELQSDLIRHAAEATLTFPLTAGTVSAPVKAKSVPLAKNRNVLVPVAIALIGLALLGLILFFVYRRRRRRDDDADIDAAGPSSPSMPGQRRPADDQVRH